MRQNTIDTLFALLRAAIGGKEVRLPSEVNWNEVRLLADQQGVTALAFDGLEMVPAECRPKGMQLMEWLGGATFIEQQNALQWSSAKELTDRLHAEGIRVLVMKGFNGFLVAEGLRLQDVLKEFGLLEFGYAMSRLAIKVCGVEIPFDCPTSDKADALIPNDILNPKHSNTHSNNARRLKLLTNISRNSWKFRYFSDTNALAFACKRIWGYLFE